MAVLEVKGVTKVYTGRKKGSIVAVDNASFEVNSGEIVGFIGPNGAGKSTAIKMITGLASPTQGEIFINGFNVRTERIKAMEKIGCIVENPDLYKNWSAVKNLEYLMSLQSFSEDETGGLIKKDFYKKRIEDLLSLVGLYERKDDIVSKYSLGMKQRLGLAQALLNTPNLLILDEPTNGLDPAGIKEVRDILQKLAVEYGMAILVSSHLLSEMQLVCDRYIVINKGKIIGNFTQSDIEEASGNNIVILTTDDVVNAKDAIKAIYGTDAEILGNGKIQFATEMPIGDVAKELFGYGVKILGITKKEISLEEFFMSLTRNNQGGMNV